jgi:hypothetical protein
MAISSELDAVHAKSLIDETMRLIATEDDIRTALKVRDNTLLTRSWACIADSKQLLARLRSVSAADDTSLH